MRNILIIGGDRSGKSHFAQELALKSGKPALFVATAVSKGRKTIVIISMPKVTK